VAHVRDTVSGASGGVMADTRTPLDGQNLLRPLHFGGRPPWASSRICSSLSDRSQTLLQSFENRILTEVALSAAEMRRPH